MAGKDMCEFKLPDTVTISTCDDLLNKALEAKSAHPKIELDSSDVDTIDTAGVQFISSLCSDVSQVTHVAISDEVKQAFEQLGMRVE